jgi:adenosylmethionine-8-amino-7-oxononanoate aminotransferase
MTPSPARAVRPNGEPEGNSAVRNLIYHVFIDMMQTQEFERNGLILTRGDGVWVWDDAGHRYLDGISGAFAVNLGHRNGRVIQAITEQLGQIAFASPLVGVSDRMLELVARLQQITPANLNTFKFHCSGAESVEAAIKLARQYHRQSGSPGKFKIISRYGSYHGSTMGAVSATGISPFRTKFEPLVPGFVKVPMPVQSGCGVTRSCPPCDMSCSDWLHMVIEREDPDTVAAVVIEPVPNMAGVQFPPPGYLEGLREMCDAQNILLIYDEIVTGFGRLGSWFAADHFGVWPDISCVGKGLTSGYAPLSAVMIADHVADVFRGEAGARVHFHHGVTYGGNPIACAAALAVLDEMEERDILSNVKARGEQLNDGLTSLRRAYPGHVRDVRSLGLLAAVDLAGFAPEALAAIEASLRAKLICIGPRPAATVRVAPPLTITHDELDYVIRAVSDAIAGQVSSPRR